tara:strand:- start:3581 stop:4135 length:555 start_codon:yes stop_codon:yes gene_type:complete
MTYTAPSRTIQRPFRDQIGRRKNWIVMIVAVVAYLLISRAILEGSGNPPIRFRLDVSPLIQSPWVLKAHVCGALASFAIGAFLLAYRKGRRLHRVLGYTWVASMAVTAISSFFLTGLNGDHFSLIHAISAWVVIILPMGVAAARRHDIKAHRAHMTNMFLGGMLVAGLFTFLPGRMMWSIFFGV